MNDVIIRAARADDYKDMADGWLNIKRIELDVYTDNQRAIHLYEKFGFVTEGTRKSLAFHDGQYVDLYHMARLRM